MEGVFPANFVTILSSSEVIDNAPSSDNGNHGNILPSCNTSGPSRNSYRDDNIPSNTILNSFNETRCLDHQQSNNFSPLDNSLSNNLAVDAKQNTRDFSTLSYNISSVDQSLTSGDKSEATLSKISNDWKKSTDDNNDEIFNDDYFKINMPAMYQDKNASLMAVSSNFTESYDNEYPTSESPLSFNSHPKPVQAPTRANTITREVDEHFDTRNPLRPSLSMNVKRGVVNTNRYDREVDQMLNIGYNEDNTGINPYGRAVYDFNAQYPNELSFRKDDIIHLVKHIDSHWTMGTIGDNRGIFPTSYIDIIVDCVDNTFESFLLRPLSTAEIPEDEGFGIVEYDFTSVEKGDVSVVAGEKIQISENIDDHWAIVITEKGVKGMCPRNHFTKIPSLEHYGDTIKKEIPSLEHYGDTIDVEELTLHAQKNEISSLLPETNTKRVYSKDDFGPIKKKEVDAELSKNLSNLNLSAVPSKPVIKKKPIVFEKPLINENKSFMQIPASELENKVDQHIFINQQEKLMEKENESESPESVPEKPSEQENKPKRPGGLMRQTALSDDSLLKDGKANEKEGKDKDGKTKEKTESRSSSFDKSFPADVSSSPLKRSKFLEKEFLQKFN